MRMKTIKINSYAKVNVGLKILNKRTLINSVSLNSKEVKKNSIFLLFTISVFNNCNNIALLSKKYDKFSSSVLPSTLE